ncbi:hypothetical protein Tco_1189662 [Tanacetum coccineum]
MHCRYCSILIFQRSYSPVVNLTLAAATSRSLLIPTQDEGKVSSHVKRDMSREVGMIWSFTVLGVCKSTKIPFVCEYGLTSECDSEDLTELLERKSDEFILNHEGDKNDTEVILLKSDLTIKV